MSNKGKIKLFCINGHEIAIVGRNKYGQCIPCTIQYSRIWYRTHKKRVKKSSQKYYKTHRKKIKKRTHRYYEKNNFPCRCGHKKNNHHDINSPIWDTWCTGRNGADNFKVCECNKYVPDNLKYLEQCLKKRGKLK